MASYNRVIIVGNLTRDPEYKQIGTGQAVCRLSIASNHTYKNRQTGAQVQDVCYIDVDVWGAQAESCRQYLSKGRSVLVEGRLKLDTWQDAQGANRSKHSITSERIVFLNSGNAGNMVEDDVQDAQMPAANYTTQNTPEFAKVEQAIAKKVATKKSTPVTSKETVGLPEFKDEPPFDEELPF